MNVRNEIKAQIIRAGMTMQEVVDLLSDEYGLTMGKGADILPWSAEVTAVTAYLLGRALGEPTAIPLSVNLKERKHQWQETME